MRAFFRSTNGPKALQAAVLCSYAIVAREIYGFERPHQTVLILLVFSVALDALLGRLLFKGWRFSPTSLVIPFATSILIDSPHLWVYLVAVTVALLSKALIRVDQRHVFNPANFGVVVMLLLASDWMTGIPGLFGSDVGASIAFFFIGLAVSIYAKTWRLSLIWLIQFLLFAFLRSQLSGVPYERLLYPMLGPTFILFTFHMITDPATVPKKFWHQFVFVLIVAAVDSYFRFNSRPYGNFFGLFFVTALTPLMRQSLAPRAGRRRELLVFYAAVLALAALALPTHLAHEERAAIDPIKSVRKQSQKEFEAKALFSEQSEQVGFRFQYEDPIVDQRLQKMLRLNFVAPGAAVADFNGDGFMDILIVNGRSQTSKNGLFLNNGGKGFVESAAAWGIANIPADLIPQSANVFDFNGDGRPDVFIAGPGCSRLYKNLGSAFEDVSAQSGLTDCFNSIGAVPFDFDGDGRMDLYVMRFFGPMVDLFDVGRFYADFAPNRWYAPTNGGVNVLFRNLGNGRFARVDTSLMPDRAEWTWDAGYTDIDGDGKFELVVANDWAQDRYYRFDSGRIDDITNSIVDRDGRSGMTVSFGFWKSKYPLIYITDVFVGSFTQRGNFLWQYSPKERRLKSFAEHRGVANCAWAWGAYFGDFDLDGETDLYVANGLVTVKAAPAQNAAPIGSPVGGSTGGPSATPSMNPELDVNFFKFSQIRTIPTDFIKRNGKSLFDYIDTTRNFGGNQRDCLFMHDATSGTFKNQSLKEPAIDFWDGRAVAAIDYDNDGDLDFVVTTQGSPSRFFVNQTPVEQRHWVGLNLQVPATEQAGAVFKFTQGEEVYYRFGSAGKSGLLAYSDPRIHLGLKFAAPVSLEIRWATGRISNVEHLLLNQYQNVQ